MVDVSGRRVQVDPPMLAMWAKKFRPGSESQASLGDQQTRMNSQGREGEAGKANLTPI